jgi:hypothetical protein
MKKLVLVLVAIIGLYAIGSAATSAMRAGHGVPGVSAIASQEKLLQNLQSSVTPIHVRNFNSSENQLPIDAAEVSVELGLPIQFTPPVSLALVTDTEPNNTRAQANPINNGDTVFCGQLTNSTDPSDYFVFALDNTYPLWQVEVYTYAPGPLECTPAISGTRVYLYDTTTAGVPIGYDRSEERRVGKEC